MKAAQRLAARARSADPSEVISWVKANQARIVRFGNTQGYVDAFNLGEQFEIGQLALAGKLKFL